MMLKTSLAAALFAVGATVPARAQVIGASATGFYANNGQPGVNATDYNIYSTDHDFFVFDLTEVSSPILSATFSAQNPVNGYFSSHASDTINFVGLSTSLANAVIGEQNGVFLYSALASGPILGSATIDAAHDGPLVSVDLNSSNALAFLNAHLGEEIVLGGSSPTLGRGDFIFGFTYDPLVTGTLAQLTLGTANATAVPEPATFGWACLALLLALAYFRHEKQRSRENFELSGPKFTHPN